ncbi:MAG: hypothetical protein Q8R55_01685 [Candidatus Taylorbacteria bacterium]|nr:hypothetical protein [Candidatus Taylorbacteria bacterium]
MRKFIIIAAVLIVVGLTLYFSFYVKDNLSRLNLDISPTESPAEKAGEEVMPVEPDKVFTEPIVYGQLKQTYSGSGFSLKYPDNFKVSSAPVESGEIITIENEKGSGFQIFITAWDEPGPITPERIWQDMPDTEINDPKNADLDGSKTLVFNGYDEDMGETFEAWTVHKGKLYQITGPKTAEKLIVETLETWGWK